MYSFGISRGNLNFPGHLCDNLHRHPSGLHPKALL